MEIDRLPVAVDMAGAVGVAEVNQGGVDHNLIQ